MNDTLYSKAITNTPVFSKENFADYFGEGTEGELVLDEWNQIDPVETIIFPESIFQVRNTIQKRTHTVFEVTTREYPSLTPLYIDSRFVQVFRSSEPPKERVVQLPSQDTVIKKLREQIGKQYVWGGNSPNGIEPLATYFPSKVPLDARAHAKWILDGFDCSGLLYWATNGYTPRNTSGLVGFGVGVDIAKKTRDEIMRILKPLDSIVWKGHTLVVIDEDEVIESTVNFAPTGKFTTPNGVRVRKMSEVLRAIQDEKKKVPVNSLDEPAPEGMEGYVVRRWWSE